MTITQVLYMLAVARHGNVSKAAESLFVSQPALSLQIKNLEGELGCALFHREPQGVTLTAAGRAFCADARGVEEAWIRLQEGSKLLGNAVCRHVRIGMGPRAFSNGLFEPVAAFFERHPETGVTFITDMGEDVLEALEEKRMDLAVDRLPPEGMGRRPERFYVSELLRERQCVLLSPEDSRSALETLPFRDLQGYAIVSGPEGSLDDRVMVHACREYGVRPARIHRADNLEAVMALVRSGKGAVLGPSSLARHYGVAAVPMLPETEIALNLICLEQNRKNPLVQQLERQLKEVLRDQ